jgi:hypothetical protein
LHLTLEFPNKLLLLRLSPAHFADEFTKCRPKPFIYRFGKSAAKKEGVQHLLAGLIPFSPARSSIHCNNIPSDCVHLAPSMIDFCAPQRL